MLKSLHKFVKINKLTSSYFKLNRRFFVDKKNEKGPDYGGVNLKENQKQDPNKAQTQKQADEGKSSTSGGMAQEQHDKSYLNSALNFMTAGLADELRSQNQPIDELIIKDHLDLKAVLQKFEQSNTLTEATKWIHQFIWEISRHSIAEEIILYPMLKKVPEGTQIWNNSLEEHRKIKEILSHVQKINDLNQLKAKVKEASDVLMHHMDVEEKEVLTAISKRYMSEDLIIEGNRFLRRKLIVPTRPHTMAPDSMPTLESLVGMMISPIDKFRDVFFQSFPNKEEVDKAKKDNPENPKH